MIMKKLSASGAKQYNSPTIQVIFVRLSFKNSEYNT
jgi:hypothetical protein